MLSKNVSIQELAMKFGIHPLRHKAIFKSMGGS
jgi:hypothetical protein